MQTPGTTHEMDYKTFAPAQLQHPQRIPEHDKKPTHWITAMQQHCMRMAIIFHAHIHWMTTVGFHKFLMRLKQKINITTCLTHSSNTHENVRATQSLLSPDHFHLFSVRRTVSQLQRSPHHPAHLHFRPLKFLRNTEESSSGPLAYFWTLSCELWFDSNQRRQTSLGAISILSRGKYSRTRSINTRLKSNLD